jgi:uncharacterized protein (TIGR02466 family)
MNEPTIQMIFPIPIMFTDIGRDFTQVELAFVQSHSTKDKTNRNVGNITSNNSYILEEPEMSDIKVLLTKAINMYVQKIYKPKYPVEAYITQSWLNYTAKGEYHHVHDHPNSFISGVLYIQTDATKDKITFHKKGYRQIQLSTDEYDIYNSDSWWFNVSTGGIVMFPSSTTHNVENVISDETRISLAFNTFVKGTLGNKELLTELITKEI